MVSFEGFRPKTNAARPVKGAKTILMGHGTPIGMPRHRNERLGTQTCCTAAPGKPHKRRRANPTVSASTVRVRHRSQTLRGTIDAHTHTSATLHRMSNFGHIIRTLDPHSTILGWNSEVVEGQLPAPSRGERWQRRQHREPALHLRTGSKGKQPLHTRARPLENNITKLRCLQRACRRRIVWQPHNPRRDETAHLLWSAASALGAGAGCSGQRADSRDCFGPQERLTSDRGGP